MAHAPIRNPFSALEVRSEDEEETYETNKNTTSSQVFILSGPTASVGIKKKKKIRPEEKKKLEEEKLKKQKNEKAENPKADKVDNKKRTDNKIVEKEEELFDENNNYYDQDHYYSNKAYDNDYNNNNYTNYYSTRKTGTRGNRGYNRKRLDNRINYREKEYIIQERELNDYEVLERPVVDNGIFFFIF